MPRVLLRAALVHALLRGMRQRRVYESLSGGLTVCEHIDAFCQESAVIAFQILTELCFVPLMNDNPVAFTVPPERPNPLTLSIPPSSSP